MRSNRRTCIKKSKNVEIEEMHPLWSSSLKSVRDETEEEKGEKITKKNKLDEVGWIRP